jgi:phosphomethylpyrimidine synthase
MTNKDVRTPASSLTDGVVAPAGNGGVTASPEIGGVAASAENGVAGKSIGWHKAYV